MGATNNMFHGKRRSLFLGILFSSFRSIFLLFRPFSFFLILIQLRYKCSMCFVGLQSDLFANMYFSIPIQIYPRAQCAALACGQGGRYPAADYWPPQIFHPCRSHPCHPCTSHRPLLATWEIAAETQRPAGLGEEFRSGIFQNGCLTTRRECSITPRQGAGALHKGAVWVAAALGLVCKKHH